MARPVSRRSPTAATFRAEPNKLVISEWQGYEAGGTKAQTYGMLAGKCYIDKYGAKQPQVRRLSATTTRS